MEYDILISIKPYWAYKIMKEEKEIEVRKFKITDTNWSGRFVCYVTKDNQSLRRIPEKDRAEFEKYIGKVMFSFWTPGAVEAILTPKGYTSACLTESELEAYAKGKPTYGYSIYNLQRFDNEPRELSAFNLTRPPQNYARINYHEGEELITENIEEE